jgi:hypothetical protein
MRGKKWQEPTAARRSALGGVPSATSLTLCDSTAAARGFGIRSTSAASTAGQGEHVCLAGGRWLVLIRSERKVVLAGGLREKYCWLVVDKRNEHAAGGAMLMG